MQKGIYLVRFKEKASKETILQKEGVQFDETPVVIKPWTSTTKFDKSEITHVDVWIQFPGLPVKYWNDTVLSKLASQVGTPKEMDIHTATKNRGGYARVLVRAAIKEEVQKQVRYFSEEGRMEDQEVIYEWLPTQCSVCRGYGHTREMCRKKIIKQIWVPKKKQLQQNGAPDEEGWIKVTSRNKARNLEPREEQNQTIIAEQSNQEDITVNKEKEKDMEQMQIPTEHAKEITTRRGSRRVNEKGARSSKPPTPAYG